MHKDRKKTDSSYQLGPKSGFAVALIILVATGWVTTGTNITAKERGKLVELMKDHPFRLQIEKDLSPYNVTGITELMVEQAYCEGTTNGFRLQVIDGKPYISGEVRGFMTRNHAMKVQLLDLWLHNHLPDGLDVLIQEDDKPWIKPASKACPVDGPVLVPAKSTKDPAHAKAILSPDHTIADYYQEGGLLSWPLMSQMLQRINNAIAWSDRMPKLLFRGQKIGPRRWIPDDLHEKFPALDVMIGNYQRSFFKRMSMPDHCKYKYLLHLPGNSYSARLKYLMACGSLVVFPEDDWIEFWYSLLKDGENLVRVPAAQLTNGSMYVEVLEKWSARDEEAKRIADAGAKLVYETLSVENVRWYWQHLLASYRSLQKFSAKLHVDAIPLEESLVAPRYISHGNRTCTVCPNTVP